MYKTILAACLLGWTMVALGAKSAPAQILIRNVAIFDGLNDELAPEQNVLVEGSLIRAIGTGDLGAAAGAIEIDGQGRTLMPGLIDGHAHVMINQNFNVVETNMDITDMAYNAAIVMKRFLVDGFTTVRDMGGSTFGLARGLDQGRVVGPRLYPSGGFISQTSGHGDFRDRRSCERLGYLRRSPYVQRSSGESAAGLRGKDV